MKSKVFALVFKPIVLKPIVFKPIVLLAIFGVVIAGFSKLPQPGEGMSYRSQMTELVHLKNAGLITEEEYRVSRKSLLKRLIH